MMGISQSYARSMALLPSPIVRSKKSGLLEKRNASARPNCSFADRITSMEPFGGFLCSCVGSHNMILFCIARSNFLCLIVSACKAAAFLSASIATSLSCFSRCLADERVPARRYIGENTSCGLGSATTCFFCGGTKRRSAIFASWSLRRSSASLARSFSASLQSAVGNLYFCEVVILIKALSVGCLLHISLPMVGEMLHMMSEMDDTLHQRWG
mmetsp:Transcript_7250/g.16022  ORF Transcript_7250/g.16022 Transcript_7250/m.16022 type:complete len:213 (-) Transcript_7250:988-1626(-)